MLELLAACIPTPPSLPAYLVGVVLCELKEQLKSAAFPGRVVRSEDDRLPGHDLGEREAGRNKRRVLGDCLGWTAQQQLFLIFHRVDRTYIVVEGCALNALWRVAL